jgi:hypothetical protein
VQFHPIYHPLSNESDTTEFRVIDLLPKSHTPDTLTCNIRHVQISENPSYEALSYVWGPQTPCFPLFCNNHQINVGQSLHDAVQRLRLDDDVRVLWVDAICINQADHVEKSWQVQMMRLIYEKSKKTVVWLGESNNEMDLVISLAGKLLYSASLMEANGDRRRMEQMSFAEIKGYQIPHLDEQTRAEFKALKALLNRPWFQRVWIIQEAAVSPEVELICGKYSIS